MYDIATFLRWYAVANNSASDEEVQDQLNLLNDADTAKLKHLLKIVEAG